MLFCRELTGSGTWCAVGLDLVGLRAPAAGRDPRVRVLSGCWRVVAVRPCARSDLLVFLLTASVLIGTSVSPSLSSASLPFLPQHLIAV